MEFKRRPKKSLRSLLMMWFVIFSVTPMAFITGFSLIKYEQAIDQELSKRLLGNGREIGIILSDFEEGLRDSSLRHANDRSFIFHLTNNNRPQLRDIVRRWMSTELLAQRIWVYNREGRLDAAMYRESDGRVERKPHLETGDIFLSEDFLESFGGSQQLALVDIQAPSGEGERGWMELVVFTQVLSATGRLVGFLEEVISIDEVFLSNLRNRVNLEILFARPGSETLISTHEDLTLQPVHFFKDRLGGELFEFFDYTLREEPYRFMLKRLNWGEAELFVGLGASKSSARAVLRDINYAFFSVFATIVVLLLVMSLVISRVLLRPLYQMLEGIDSADLTQGPAQIPITTETEIGLLAESFADMSKRTFETQKALKDKIRELEEAYIEIRDTQAKLVHTAKMASVGQLVAGVAHELNNPIGFIYSNMTHLKDYSEKLMALVDELESEKSDLDEIKRKIKKIDYDYIKQDMPKLIQSCEDGARRTRDIVLGLRNFSRLEEAQLKEVDIHEGLDNTLRLLTGEIKNRIQVEKDYGTLPPVLCYPSQLNQVFMNILSNAAQAIEGEGTIWIRTETSGQDQVKISIRDSGRGMSKATVDKIFDPFFTTKSLSRGTGLGLSISYGIVQKHGGDLLVHSEPGKGTEFVIVLPLKAVSN